MKKIIFLLFICAASTVNAQKSKIIKTNPLGFLFNVYSIGYEQEVTPNQSFNINLLYSDYSDDNFDIKGPGISLSYRFYLQNVSFFGNASDPLEGFFIGPSLGYTGLKFKTTGAGNSFISKSSINVNGVKIDTTNSTQEIETSNFNMGGILGYQWNWNPITLELYAGLGFTKVNYDDNDSLSGTKNGFGLTNAGLSIGYSF